MIIRVLNLCIEKTVTGWSTIAESTAVWTSVAEAAMWTSVAEASIWTAVAAMWTAVATVTLESLDLMDGLVGKGFHSLEDFVLFVVDCVLDVVKSCLEHVQASFNKSSK